VLYPAESSPQPLCHNIMQRKWLTKNTVDTFTSPTAHTHHPGADESHVVRNNLLRFQASRQYASLSLHSRASSIAMRY
jgi:hypothetical protein